MSATNTNLATRSVSVSGSGKLQPAFKKEDAEPQQDLMLRSEERVPSLVEIGNQATSKSGHVAWTLQSDKQVSGNDLSMWAHGYTGSDSQEVNSWKSQSAFYYQSGNLDKCDEYCKHDANCAAFEDHKNEDPVYCVFKSNDTTSTAPGIDVHVINVTWVRESGKDVSGTDSKVMAEMFSSSHIGSNIDQWGQDGDEFYHEAGDAGIQKCKDHCRNTNSCVAFVDMSTTDPPHCIFHSSSALSGSSYSDRNLYVLQ
jgi:hypothetical protein